MSFTSKHSQHSSSGFENVASLVDHLVRFPSDYSVPVSPNSLQLPKSFNDSDVESSAQPTQLSAQSLSSFGEKDLRLATDFLSDCSFKLPNSHTNFPWIPQFSLNANYGTQHSHSDTHQTPTSHTHPNKESSATLTDSSTNHCGVSTRTLPWTDSALICQRVSLAAHRLHQSHNVNKFHRQISDDNSDNQSENHHSDHLQSPHNRRESDCFVPKCFPNLSNFRVRTLRKCLIVKKKENRNQQEEAKEEFDNRSASSTTSAAGPAIHIVFPELARNTQKLLKSKARMAQRHFEDLEDNMEMSQAPALSSIEAIMAPAASTMQLRPVMATVVESASATVALAAPKSPPGFVNPSKLDLGGSILALSAHSTILSAAALKQFQLAFIKCQNELQRKWVKGDVNESVSGGLKTQTENAMDETLFAEEERLMREDAMALQVPSLATLKKRKAGNVSVNALHNDSEHDECVEKEDDEDEDGSDVEEHVGEDEACALSRRFAKSNAKRRRIRKDADGRSFIELSMSSVPPLHTLAQMNADTSEEVAAYALARNLVDFGEQFLKEEKEFKDAHKKGKTIYRKVSKPAVLSLSASSPTSSVASLESDLESLPLSEELPSLSMLSDVSTPGSDSDEHERADIEANSDAEEDDVEQEDGLSEYRDEEVSPFPLFDRALSDVPTSFPYSPINSDHMPLVPSLDFPSSSAVAVLDDLSDLTLSFPAFPQSSPKASPRASPSFAFSAPSLFQALSSPTAFGFTRTSSIGTALESVH